MPRVLNIGRAVRRVGSAIDKQLGRSANDVRKERERVMRRLKKVTIRVEVQLKEPPPGALFIVSFRGVGGWYEGKFQPAEDGTESRSFKALANSGPHVVEASIILAPAERDGRAHAWSHKVEVLSIGAKDRRVRMRLP